MTSSMITLECPDCKRTLLVARADTDPASAARAVLQCDRCDDGDRHSPEFFDAAGRWLSPMTTQQGVSSNG